MLRTWHDDDTSSPDMKATKTKHAQLTLAPSRNEGDWKSSSIMVMDMKKMPKRDIEFSTFDDLREQALIFAKTRVPYELARALEATDDTTKGIPGVEVHFKCLDARKPAGWKKATAHPIHYFPDPAEDAILEGTDLRAKTGSGEVIYLTCDTA